MYDNSEHLLWELTKGKDAFVDYVEFLEGVEVTDCEVYECGSDLLREINFRINCIYDFADSFSIWLG